MNILTDEDSQTVVIVELNDDSKGNCDRQHHTDVSAQVSTRDFA